MACNTKTGPAALIGYVETHCGVKITQTDWHALRVLAQREEDGTGSRARATDQQVESAVESLSYIVASDVYADLDHEGYKSDTQNYLNLSDEEYLSLTPQARDFVDETQRLEATLRKSKVTVGSLEAIGYISAWGTDKALDRARAEIAAQKDQRKADTPRDKAWQDHMGTAIERSHSAWKDSGDPIYSSLEGGIGWASGSAHVAPWITDKIGEPSSRQSDIEAAITKAGAARAATPESDQWKWDGVIGGLQFAANDPSTPDWVKERVGLVADPDHQNALDALDRKVARRRGKAA